MHNMKASHRFQPTVRLSTPHKKDKDVQAGHKFEGNLTLNKY